MKRLVTLAAVLLLTAFATRAQEPVPATPELLTEQEWDSIPPAVREKLKRILSTQNLHIAAPDQKGNAGFTLMVEDGRHYYTVPAGSIFSQAPRDRKAPRDGNYVYSRWCDMTDIDAAYISPQMFEITRRLPKFDIQGTKVDLSPIIREFSGLYMLDFAQFRKGDPTVTYSRNTTSGGLRKDIRDFLDAGHYTTLMDLRKDGYYTRIYMAARGDIVTGFVLVNLDDSFNYGRFICLEGNMPKKEFQKILSMAIK